MVLDAEEHFAASNRPVDDLDYAGFDPVAYEARTREERDRATVSLAVSVCDGVARELYRLARPFGWSVDRLTATATMLSDQYLAYTYAQKHSKHLWYHSMPGCEVTLADFAAAVHRELERWPWWPRLQGLIRDLSAQKTKRPADAGARPFFPKRAAWVEAEMKKRRITALNQLKKAEGPDRKTVKRILAGNGQSSGAPQTSDRLVALRIRQARLRDSRRHPQRLPAPCGQPPRGKCGFLTFPAFNPTRSGLLLLRSNATEEPWRATIPQRHWKTRCVNPG